ncbi:MAG: DNA double-strand break repair nuclease NurA [Candidatus Heimdallarchaeota archaeon]
MTVQPRVSPDLDTHRAATSTFGQLLENIQEHSISRYPPIAQEIMQAIPQLRHSLKSQIHVLDEVPPYARVAAVDGSNSKPRSLLLDSYFSYSAAAVFQYFEGPQPTLPYHTKSYWRCVPGADLTPRLVEILRDREELQMILRATTTQPDLILGDGSILASSLWLARQQEMQQDPRNLQGRRLQLVQQIFNSDFAPNVPDNLFGQIVQLLVAGSPPLVYIPKNVRSRGIIRSFVPELLEKAPDITDPAILRFLLRHNEFIGPISYHSTLSTGTTHNSVRYISGDLMVTYYQAGQPGLHNPLKVEFHRNQINRLPRILNTLKFGFNTKAGIPNPLFLADRQAVRSLLDLNAIIHTARQAALDNCRTPEEMFVIHVLFDLAVPSHSFG